MNWGDRAGLKTYDASVRQEGSFGYSGNGEERGYLRNKWEKMTMS